MPAFGFAAVPSPKKKPSKVPSPCAEAVGAAADPNSVGSWPGSPVEVDAAALAVVEALPSSRRLTAKAVHISGAAAGASPLVPACNQDSRPRPRPETEELLEAGCAAVITGACAAAGATTASTTAAAGDGDESVSAGEAESMVVSTSASVALGGSDGVETEPSFPAFPDADGIEGAEGAVAESDLAERLPRRGVRSGRAASDPPRASVSAPTAGISTGAELSEAGLSSEAGPDAGESDESSAESPADAPRAPRAPRAVLRVGVEVDAPAVEEDEASEVSEPVDPEDPLVSANAIGIAEMPEPTPKATARAPTRPTYRA